MKLIKAIYKFIDKRIILPITRLITSIGDKLKKVNKPLESMLRTKSSTIILSLVIATIIFLVVDKSNLTLENNAEVLYNQPVTAVYNNEEYVVEGLPETVDITMIGTRANLYLAKQLSTQLVTVDLSDLKVGTHQVNLRYKQAITNVEYKLDPSTVSVTISSKQSLTKDITNEVVNLDKLDSKYAIKNLKLINVVDSKDKKEESDKDEHEEITTVIVKGKEDKIKEVASVKALINVDYLSGNDVNEGENTIKEVPLIAYDDKGQKMDVELVPSKVWAIVNLESSSKEVPINVVVKNIDNIVFGKAIETIEPSINKVTIYGSNEVLENISKLDVEISIPKDLKTNKKFTQTIKKPTGVRKLSNNTISVDLKLGEQSTTEVSGVKISYKNLDSKFVVQATQGSVTEVPVILTGVESVIKDISSTDVDAFVDLKDITQEGEVTVKVSAKGNDNRVTYESRVKEVKLLIIKK